MLKTISLTGGILGLIASLSTETPPPYPALDTKTKEKWRSEIGLASFRNNVVIQSGRIYIGSNGNSFMDRGFIEPSSGVYVLDARTGTTLHHFANERFGDMDVTGLSIRNDRIYFGNDNEEFLCTDRTGRILWRNPTAGDIEHEPVWLNTPNGLCVVYAAESGEVKAVDPQTGNIRWSYYVPDFKGWKPGDNRTLFKVKAWFQNTRQFYTKPLAVDLNQDGVEDLVYLVFGGKLIALNGRTGTLMWSNGEENAWYDEITLVGKGKERKIVALRSTYEENNTHGQECVFLSLSGKIVRSIPLAESSSGSGLNALPLGDGRVALNGRTKTYLISPDYGMQVIDRTQPFMMKLWDNTLASSPRNDFAPLFADRTFPLPDGKTGIIVLNQHDQANSESGFLEILSLEDLSVIDRYSIPSGSEMPPVIQDVDQDGQLEILIAGYDGFLYCYALPKY